jgi:hypothetical protein
MLFAAVTHLAEGLSAEHITEPEGDNSVVYLVGTRGPAANFVLEMINEK